MAMILVPAEAMYKYRVEFNQSFEKNFDKSFEQSPPTYESQSTHQIIIWNLKMSLEIISACFVDLARIGLQFVLDYGNCDQTTQRNIDAMFSRIIFYVLHVALTLKAVFLIPTAMGLGAVILCLALVSVVLCSVALGIGSTLLLLTAMGLGAVILSLVLVRVVIDSVTLKIKSVLSELITMCFRAFQLTLALVAFTLTILVVLLGAVLYTGYNSDHAKAFYLKLLDKA